MIGTPFALHHLKNSLKPGSRMISNSEEMSVCQDPISYVKYLLFFNTSIHSSIGALTLSSISLNASRNVISPERISIFMSRLCCICEEAEIASQSPSTHRFCCPKPKLSVKSKTGISQIPTFFWDNIRVKERQTQQSLESRFVIVPSLNMTRVKAAQPE